MFRVSQFICVFFVAASLVCLQRAEAQIEFIKYGPHTLHQATIMHAPAWTTQSAPPPVFVYFHGGGFKAGAPEFGPLWSPLWSKGVTVVAATHRFIQNGATKDDIMRDGARVIQFLRLNAKKYDIDPDRIAVGGYSSGGVVAAWVGLHDELANPLSADLVLRQSSRVSAICLYDAQVHPMFLSQWQQYTGASEALLQKTVYAYTSKNLNGRMFPDPFKPSNFPTIAAYNAALLAYDIETSAFTHASADDPPVCFLNSKTTDPNVYLRNWNDSTGLHSPLLMIPLKNRLTEVGVHNQWAGAAPTAQFLINELVYPAP